MVDKVSTAWVARDQDTKECYAVCACNAGHVADMTATLNEWISDGAIIELLSSEDALTAFAEGMD